MVDCGAGGDGDRGQRELVLVIEPEPDVESDEMEGSVRQLRAEIKDLDVESIEPVVSEEAPSGAKGDPMSLGALLVTLSATGGVFTVLISTVRDWLIRHASARRIMVTIDGDTIVLERSSVPERDALIKAFIRRHGMD